ncbi:endocuticle structural glycoprotein SgAbd-3-like [Anthonomus grandis grandis]|uniref:endocuticle structural glycoprotein SgAbd-3-like n=1 Tax=Anthonomus grandis grandis TaxID=2921223 RepID=UPI0021665D39|nr:endocuticle structural glycoprotein SgAbd-3-like [Anthonomus grandis grandis]
MMFCKVAFLLVIASTAVLGAPQLQQQQGKEVPIISQESDIQPDGSFKWSFEAGDGTKAEQSGQPKQIEKETPVVMQGSASWTDNEGGNHQLTYVADENGYQPQSNDLPIAPEIPAAIQRALEWNAAHPEQDGNQ